MYNIAYLCFSQGFITDDVTIEMLIRKYLPLEYRRELIPIARAGNIVELTRYNR